MAGTVTIKINKNMKNLLLIMTAFAMIVAISGCRKKIDCDATVTWKNCTSDTIFYNSDDFSCSLFNAKLPPGQSVSKSVGHIEIKNGTQSTVTTYFECSRGSFYVKVEECNVVQEIH